MRVNALLIKNEEKMSFISFINRCLSANKKSRTIIKTLENVKSKKLLVIKIIRLSYRRTFATINSSTMTQLTQCLSKKQCRAERNYYN